MRIAIVDDRPLAIEALRRVVASVPGYSVAWIARDGEEAVRRCADDRPDLVLMDLVMPGLNGVEATRRIMSATPCPIVVVTATVSGNFSLVYDALAAGAVDAVNTPTVGTDGLSQGGEALLAKIAQVAKKIRSAATASPTPAPFKAPLLPPIVAIGASTGGPQATADVLAQFPAGFPGAVLLVQHISSDFGAGLAEWLQQKSRFPVRVAVPGESPVPGAALLAGRDEHLVLRPDGTLDYTQYPIETPFRPNIDTLFQSLANHSARPGVGILLTGMHRDGADGLLKLRKAGWATYAQDPATCVVAGMPQAAIKTGAAGQVLTPEQIGRSVRALVRLP